MKQCKTCDWYHSDCCSIKSPRSHVCQCPKILYGYHGIDADPDGMNVEDDEGWGMRPGPEFGCIHHKEKEE